VRPKTIRYGTDNGMTLKIIPAVMLPPDHDHRSLGKMPMPRGLAGNGSSNSAMATEVYRQPRERLAVVRAWRLVRGRRLLLFAERQHGFDSGNDRPDFDAAMTARGGEQ
jgi:hypothetical protein